MAKKLISFEDEAEGLGLPDVVEDRLDGAFARVFGVADPTANPVLNITLIQSAVDAAGAAGGGTVLLAPGQVYDVSGTIHMHSNVVLDLNKSTLFAVADAAFDVVDLGPREDSSERLYNPATVKPIISVHGTNNGERLTGVVVRNGTVDGNGVNQPDEGSYANIMALDADSTVIEDIRSLRARPGLTINTGPGGESGPNTGRRAFCLLIGRALGTVVSRGYYSDSGYDVIGLRAWADSTQLIGVQSGKAWKGSIQAGSDTYRTKIIGGIWDNTAGEGTSSNALYCHSSTDFLVTGATVRASKGACLAAFGTAEDGYASDIVLKDSTIEHDGSSAHVINLGNGYVRRASVDNVVFAKTNGNGQLIYVSGSTISGVKVKGTRGSLSGVSPSVVVQNAHNIEFADCDIKSAATGNALFQITGTTGFRVNGGSYEQQGGMFAYFDNTHNVTFSGCFAQAADSVRAYENCSNVDVLDCDFTAITNLNKLRLYGPTSGSVRGNKGAATELTGAATVAAGAISVTLPHGLWPGTGASVPERVDRHWVPSDFQVSFAGDPGEATACWVSSVTPTQVTITLDAAPGVDVPISWSARMDRTTQPGV